MPTKLPRKTDADAKIHVARIKELIPTVLAEMGIDTYKFKIHRPFSPLSWLIDDTDGHYNIVFIYVPEGKYGDTDALERRANRLLMNTEVSFYSTDFNEVSDLSKIKDED